MSDPSPQPGTPLHGPGGLLGTPGLGTPFDKLRSGRRKGRKWGQRLKAKQIVGNLYRGDNGKFQAGSGGGTSGGGTSGAAPARGRQLSKQPPIKTAKPVKTVAPKKGRAAKKPAGAKPKDPAVAARQQQRDQEHTQDRAQRQADRQARLARQAQRDQEHTQDRAQRQAERAQRAAERQAKQAAAKQPKAGGGGSKKPSADDKRREQSQRAIDTAGEVGLQTRDLEDLRQAAAGLGGVNNPAMTKLGLIGADGLTTDQGRRALSALERGDVRQYRAALQDAQARQGREAAAAQRKQQTEGRRAGAQAERNAAKQRQLDRLKRRAQGGASLTQAQRDQLTDAGMASDDGQMWRLKVYTDPATNKRRWIARSTTAYRDSDGEIIASAALDQDSQRMMATKDFGPLRYWHIGQPDPFDVARPCGPGLDIGTCDYSVLIGRTRIESGTFNDAAIADRVAAQADRYEMSPGFFYPDGQPDAAGVFSAIRTFERSIVPTRYARASNRFTGLAVKEHRMDPNEMERRFKAAITDLGLDGEQALALGQQLVATEKAAQQQGIAFKSADAPAAPDEITINGVVYALKAAPPAPADQGMTDVAEMAADDMPLDEDVAVEEAPMGEYLGDMSWDEFAAKLGELLAPVLKLQDMVKSIGDTHAELKTMYGGAATKDDARAQEIAALKSQQAELAVKLAAIEGDQPAVVLPDDVTAALKSAGPTAPATPDDPEVAEALNDPSRPYAGLAARTMPALYRNTPDGGFAGWQPPAAP